MSGLMFGADLTLRLSSHLPSGQVDERVAYKPPLTVPSSSQLAFQAAESGRCPDIGTRYTHPAGLEAGMPGIPLLLLSARLSGG